MNELRNKTRTIIALSVVSSILAICLIITLICGDFTKGPGTGTVSSSNNSETLLGNAGIRSIGEHKSAGSFSEIYDYLTSQYKNEGIIPYIEERLYGTDLINKEGIVMEDAAGATESQASPSHSSTNLVTIGVDESDISKTDGDYIYNVTASEIIIFDIKSGEPKEITRFVPDTKSPSDYIHEIYVDNNTMIIVTDHMNFDLQSTNSEETVILTYDISDRKNPVNIGRYAQSGFYKTSRKIDDIIYLYTNYYFPDPGKNKDKALLPENLLSWIPSANGKTISPDCIYLKKSGINSLVMTSFNINSSDKTIDAKVMIDDYFSEVYVSKDAAYVYRDDYATNRNILKITKFDYDNGNIDPTAFNTVLGSLNDTFAINENNGYLRLVTTSWEDGTNTNTLYVLDENLDECGRINNIASGESLYACRFLGDACFFVTYRNTDPLFYADLSEPNDPRIVSEIKLPGFSEYLHFWGENKLLGIGYDGDEEGNILGLKLSMFDISNPAEMSEESKLAFTGDYSEGFYDYKAVMIDPEKNLFGFSYKIYSEKSKLKYDFYSYVDGEFVLRSSIDASQNGNDKLRGHYSGDNVYVTYGTYIENDVLR